MTPIADPRAVEAADKFSGITQEHVATWGNSTLVRNARACRKEGFLAGWQARSAAGPATREQGSEQLEELFTRLNNRVNAIRGTDGPECGQRTALYAVLRDIEAMLGSRPQPPTKPVRDYVRRCGDCDAEIDPSNPGMSCDCN